MFFAPFLCGSTLGDAEIQNWAHMKGAVMYRREKLAIDVWTPDVLRPLLRTSCLRVSSDSVPARGPSLYLLEVFRCYKLAAPCLCDCRPCVLVQGGRGTCASALWPLVSRSSSCFPVRRWLFTSSCCRPSSCAWSSSSAPSCSASTAWSSCSDCSPYRPSPGEHILTVSAHQMMLWHLEVFTLYFYVFLTGPRCTEEETYRPVQRLVVDKHCLFLLLMENQFMFDKLRRWTSLHWSWCRKQTFPVSTCDEAVNRFTHKKETSAAADCCK